MDVESNDKPVLHNRLALFRVERGWSRRDVAAAVGVNPQTVGFIERGQYGPSLELGLRLAALFEVPVETLFALRPFASLGSQLAPERHPVP